MANNRDAIVLIASFEILFKECLMRAAKSLGFVAVLAVMMVGLFSLRTWADNVPASNSPSPNPAGNGNPGLTRKAPLRALASDETGKFFMFMLNIKNLNMTPDFTLSADQKKQINAIKGDWDKANKDFQDEHGIAKLQASLGQAWRHSFQNGARGEPDAAVNAAQKTLDDAMKDAPKADPYLEKVHAVLTTDQQKALADLEAANKAAAEKQKVLFEKMVAPVLKEKDNN